MLHFQPKKNEGTLSSSSSNFKGDAVRGQK